MFNFTLYVYVEKNFNIMNVDVPTNVGASPLIMVAWYLLSATCSLEMGVAIPICIMRYCKTRFEGCDITFIY